MSAFLALVAIVELLVILWLWSDNRALDADLQRERRSYQTVMAQLVRVQNKLRALQADDGRWVDQLIEKGRQEVARLEAYYQRHLPEAPRWAEEWRPKGSDGHGS